MSKASLVANLQATPRSDGLWPVECLRVGHWDYSGIPGGLHVDEGLLAELVENFDAGAKGFEVLLNREHDDERPAGWVKGLRLAPDRQSLFALMDITDEESRQDVEAGKIKYVSSELDLAWVDPEDKKEKRVFEGLALTNRPYIKRLKPIGVVLSERSANLHLDCDVEREPVSGPTGKEKEPTVSEKNEPTKDTPGGGAVALSELEAKLKDETKARQTLEARLAEERETTRALGVKFRMSEAKTRINRTLRRGKITPAFANNLLSLTETFLQYGETTAIKLREKRKPLRFKLGEMTDEEKAELDEGGPVDELDVIETLLDLVDTLPDSLAAEAKPDTLELEDDAKSTDEEDDLDKLAQIAMKEDKNLTYTEAIQLAERKQRERKGGAKR